MIWTFEQKGTIEEVVKHLNTNPDYEQMPTHMKHNLRQILHHFDANAIMNVVCYGDVEAENHGEITVQINVSPAPDAEAEPPAAAEEPEEAESKMRPVEDSAEEKKEEMPTVESEKENMSER